MPLCYMHGGVSRATGPIENGSRGDGNAGNSIHHRRMRLLVQRGCKQLSRESSEDYLDF